MILVVELNQSRWVGVQMTQIATSIVQIRRLQSECYTTVRAGFYNSKYRCKQNATVGNI